MAIDKKQIIQPIFIILAALLIFLFYYANKKAEGPLQEETPEERIQRELMAPPLYEISEEQRQQIPKDLADPPLQSLSEEQKEKVRQDLMAPSQN
ncbi:MAG: hypothetical protein HYT49_02875 [Candidatus Wildermuthbacteria bacterium]|nr:hypothetical protein [Candidatus Wildermuthbacteria bacterium]